MLASLGVYWLRKTAPKPTAAFVSPSARGDLPVTGPNAGTGINRKYWPPENILVVGTQLLRKRVAEQTQVQMYLDRLKTLHRNQPSFNESSQTSYQWAHVDDE